ncbi:MAG: pyridoxamine-phosphate oxidase [Xanthomonadales bacterium]|nr:pyridoxamine 5'-phosphate oxidase family protein [Gammaproteobacteria bacterium]MBT8051568.1 pyridoxamine 5'-phosphate oxidase family protein [Gammaproteobacteria bacterium]MBT8074154.1 pyridoxamine 5'-phosphate oxidase family protein [Gammaproteobacteria bacterium]NNK05007.1 pyridoxamine-phosphate oxidase [Xanthomonadales bacterium]
MNKPDKKAHSADAKNRAAERRRQSDFSQEVRDIHDLYQIQRVSWELLREGVVSAKSPLHTASLATIGEHGPSLRTVVLRHCDEEQRMLACHGDVRSAKVREAEADPRASWLFYDRERKLQLRLAGLLSIHVDDAFADSRWDTTTDFGRACYNTERGPGQQVPQPAGAPSLIDNEKDEQLARSHFAVIACRIDFMDWLVLSSRGHRRAHFHWREVGWKACWVLP